MRLGAILLATLTLMADSSFAQEPASAVATIEATAREGGLRLVGRTFALTAGRFDARMTIEKSGPSGRTSTTQGGAVTLAAGEAGDVATVGLSVAPGDQLSVELVVSADGQELSRSRMSVGK